MAQWYGVYARRTHFFMFENKKLGFLAIYAYKKPEKPW